MRKPAIIVGVVIVCLIVIGAAVRFNVNNYRPQIESKLAEKLNRNVSMGNVRLGLIPPRLRVENPVIGDDPAFETRAPFVRADSLDVSLRLLPLLGGNLDIASMELRSPSVELIKNPRGVWNFSTFGAGGTTQGGRTFSIGTLSIKDGQVAVTDLERKQPRTVYDHIDLNLTDYAPGKTFSADVAAHLPGTGAEDLHLQGKAGPVPAGNMATMPFSGTLDLKEVSLGGLQKFAGSPMLAKADGIMSGQNKISSTSGGLAASGNLKIEKPVINGIDVGYPITADYNLSGNLAADQIHIDTATVKLGQTPITVTGTLNMQSTPPQVDLNVKSGDISIAEISRLASAFGVIFSPQTNVAGLVALDVKAQGPADRPQLTGNISARDVKLSGKEIPQPIGIRTIGLTLTPAEIQSNDFEIASAGTTVASHVALLNYASNSASIDATLRAPNATLPAIIAIAKAYGITALDKISGGSGTLSLDLHAAGPVHEFSSPGLLRALNGSASLNFNGLRISGTNINRELSSIAGFLKPGHSNEDYTDISHLTGHIVIKNGVAQTNDVLAQLSAGSLSARGTADLATEALNLRATAVFSKSFADQVGGTSIGGYLTSALANSQGELVVPAIITGTFQNPRFAPDAQQIAQMKLKNLLPTTGNPAQAVSGLLGGFIGQKNPNQPPTARQKPADTVNKILGNILGGKK